MPRYAILLCALLSGCGGTQYYAHATKSPSEFQKDAYECERDAAVIHSAERRSGMEDRCLAVRGWTRTR